MAAPRNLILVDANHLLHRVMRQSATTELKFGGVFGFVRCLRGVLERYPFRQCVACWDGGLSARRLQLLPTYKHRDLTPEQNEYRTRFRMNRAYLHLLLPHLGVLELKMDGREADDLIYQARELIRDLAHAAQTAVGAIIISEDRDFLQMVELDTEVYQPRLDRYVTVSSFEPITQIPLSRFLLFKSVLGDTGDNIPGIKGVGDVTATQIAREVPLPESEQVSGPPQWGEVPAWCSVHENKRVRSVAASWDVVLRNYELVTFASEVFTEDERELLRTSLAARVQVDSTRAYDVMDTLQFASLLYAFADWIVPFRRLESGPCFRRL